jgi:Zn-dependent protease/predicted transcriptional regulator
MFGKRIKLFKLFGFEIGIDFSWIIIAVLIAWSLSTGYFPFEYRNLSTQAYWLMGAVGAVGLFVSIIAHEFCHSLVARRRGVPMKGITLFIFGGVAEMGDEPSSAGDEFKIAIVGPLSSVIIGIIFYVLYKLGAQGGWPPAVNGVLGYLSMINFLLAAFNLLPAFPLDGGRVLRSILWGWKGNLRWATHLSSRIGSYFGVFLIIFGVYRVLTGNFIGGMWLFLIGLFLQNAAKMSYQQLLIRKTLEGEPLKRFMNQNPVTVPPSITIEQLVEDYIYRYHFKMFPVVEGEKLVGCVTTGQVKEVPRDAWSQTRVADLAAHCSAENTVEPDTDSVKALSIMRSHRVSRLMVVQDNRLLGIISLKDMLEFLSLKVDLDK